MADRSAIEWTDATWNPIRAVSRATGKVGHHCEHVSEGCRFCYAERMNGWRGTRLPYKPAHRADVEIVLDERTLRQPLHWRRPRMIFAGSMTDLFADFVPDAMLDRVFAVMALCPQHTFQVLTKRPERMRAYVTEAIDLFHVGAEPMDDRFGEIAVDMIGHADGHDIFEKVDWPLPNVWLGTSCEDQATADARIPELLTTPAAVRFVSAEPLLGPIDFGIAWHGETALGAECWGDCGWCENGRPPLHNCQDGQGDSERGRSGLDWVIIGGESGPQARPMHPAWARDIRDQCAATDVAFHYKQTGEWKALSAGDDGFWPTDGVGAIRLTYSGERHDDGVPMQRVGKKFAGRLLDGVEHNGIPCGAAPCR